MVRSKAVTLKPVYCCLKIVMIFEIFRKFIVLYFCLTVVSFGQTADNDITVELGSSAFPIERPFTISLIIVNSDTRPTVLFPDITGFVKKGVTTSVTPSETGGKTVVSQVITQSYTARAPGRFQLPPFNITVNGETVHSEGTTLTVRPSTTNPVSVTPLPTTVVASAAEAAFLSLRASKSTIYTGEGVALTLSLFVSDNYPYELSFMTLDKQLQAIVKKIRPANSWEENLNINELKPFPAVIGGHKYREYRLYESVFFPLSTQALRLPAVSLQLFRPRPVIGPPTAQAETVLFTSKPLLITVRPLPPHASRGRLPVGSFRLEESLERSRVRIGQSIRYTLTIIGVGNIATLPVPVLANEQTDIDVFPPEERHTLSHVRNQITGRKSFSYFIVPHQNGLVALADFFQWTYFDPRTAQYETLRPHLQLLVGGQSPAVLNNIAARTDPAESGEAVKNVSSAGQSLYAGIEAMDSTRQSINITTLVRSVANVLIVIMLIGMLFIFFRK